MVGISQSATLLRIDDVYTLKYGSLSTGLIVLFCLINLNAIVYVSH